MSTKILKNNTGSDIVIIDAGIIVPASGQYELQDQDFLIWSASTDITAPVNAGDVIINDGTSDLSASDGLRYLQYPDRMTIQQDDSDVAIVTTVLNFEGSVNVVDNGNGKATVTVTSNGDTIPKLKQVDCILLACGYINNESCGLVESDTVNHLVHNLIEGEC